MSRIFVTSDTHFGHDREFLFSPRGFTSIQEHDAAVIANWNSVVGPDDVVYHLGDVMLGDNAYGITCLKLLNGNIKIIPGNHDINNSKAITFENGFEEPTDITTPEDFREIYADFGYADADSVFVPKEGYKGGMLSYTEVIGGYKLIAIDSCMYSEDNGAEGNEHMTDGRIGDDLLEWIVAECEDAEEKGLLKVHIYLVIFLYVLIVVMECILKRIERDIGV